MMVKGYERADVRSQFKSFEPSDIEAQADDAIFQKGYDYYQHHALTELTLSESVIGAWSAGSDAYHVWATLLPAKERSARRFAAVGCSCPQDGFCEHVVALLLTWLHHPEDFVVCSRLVGRLSTKSRPELLALLRELMKQQPDIEPLIEVLVELPLVPVTQDKPGKGRILTIDPSAIRSQVDTAFYNAGERWDAAGRVARELERLSRIGKSFAENGQWANALAVYATIAEQTLRYYDRLQDEGQVSWVMQECAAGLVECLDAQSELAESERLSATERDELLTALFDLWKFGSRYGGIDSDIAAAIAAKTTRSEQKKVEAWVRKEMRPVQDGTSQWHNRAVVAFLVTLKEARHEAEEDVLAEYLDAGLYKELAEKLLQQGKPAQALQVAQANVTEMMDVTWFASQLLALGQTWVDVALTFVETRLALAERALKPKDYTTARAIDMYRNFLGEKYLLYGKAKQALDMQLARFQANPDEDTYRSVQSAAQANAQPETVWSELQPQLKRTLEQQSRWSALVNIYLSEGDVALAISALSQMERAPSPSPYSPGFYTQVSVSQYQARVAQAAEESFPNDALRLYKSVVQTLIAGRGRENYRQATDYLIRIRELYHKQGEQAEWQGYMTNLRNSNKTLRALKEELDKRKL